uniref:DUF7870 domain-containing protein n=1 Tax=Nelumbo nucifera TaxID=4432 RepID=A0A822XXG3_NELNU|nr:TPA_asm: hypothetical protein HUJ06_023551 [Nelumbo nucifera]
MEFGRGFPVNNQTKIKHLHGEGEISLNPDNQLTIMLPDSRVLRVIARSVLLALIIATFPWIGPYFIDGLPQLNSNLNGSQADFGPEPINVEFLPELFQDLANEGLLNSGGKTLLVSQGGGEEVITQSPLFTDDNFVDLISEFDTERQSLVPDDTFDFAFAPGFGSGEFIDRTLKIGGIAAVQLSDNPRYPFRKPSNYKIVYIRRFASTIVAMKKTGPAEILSGTSPIKRRLSAFASEAKQAALNRLEDALLEPPRASKVELGNYLKTTRYLPDLMEDSLEGYPRHVFIDVDLQVKSNASPGWFEQNYPTRNKDFEVYKIDMVTTDELSPDKGVPQMEMSDWLWKNVKEEEYVVMKAEAEVVEEMMKSNNRRPYWECLALYGRLRDEGVAVHQWWG